MKRTGYTLHTARLEFSSGEAVRTIVFPLEPFIKDFHESKALYDRIKEGIIHDDLVVRGAMNASNYLEEHTGKRTFYTLYDFWIDSLRCGVIWMSSSAELVDFIRSIYHIQSPVDSMWQSASDEIRMVFEEKEFKEQILLRESIRSSSSRDSFKKRLENIVKKNMKENSEAERVIQKILNGLFDADGKLLLDAEGQLKFWKQTFGIDKNFGNHQGNSHGDITFFIVQDLLTDLSANVLPTDLVKIREDWLRRVGKKNLLEKILGLSDNFNGFSNYFNVVVKALQEDKIGNVFDRMLAVVPHLASDRDIYMPYLSYLASRAKLLGTPKMPGVSSWAEYRSVFGGKLLSWFSNMLKREQELEAKTEEFIQSAMASVAYLDQFSQSREDARQSYEELNRLIQKIVNFLKNPENALKNESAYEVFSLYLSLIRREVNIFYQQFIKKEQSEESVDEFPQLKIFFQNMPRPVHFYGEAKRRKYHKLLFETIPIIEEGITIARDLLSSLFASLEASKISFQLEGGKTRDKGEGSSAIQEETQKILQFFFRKIQTQSLNSKKFQSFYTAILLEYTKNPSWEILQRNMNKYVYYKSKYNKGTQEEVLITPAQTGDEFLSFVRKIVEFLQSFDSRELMNDKEWLLDTIELAKMIISGMARWIGEQSLPSLSLFSFEHFPQIKRYRDSFVSQDFSAREWMYIINSLFFSEFRGAATTFCMNRYNAKYTIQVIQSDKKFPLFSVYKEAPEIIKRGSSLDPYDSASRDVMVMHHRYVVAVRKMKLGRQKSDDINALQLEKKSIKPVSILPEEYWKLFAIRSSGYQCQFLDAFVSRPKKWRHLDISLNEWSFVLEQQYALHWDISKKHPVFSMEDTQRSSRLFLAVPCALSGKNPHNDTVISLKTIHGETSYQRLKYPILGVDVGEYGLAYCVVQFVNYDPSQNQVREIKILEKGFIEDRNVAKIKDAFAEIQKRSQKGVFDETDTTVSRVRENAIGALRNKLHAILIRYPGSIVYEHSISNFETGSGKTTKIYNSVKRADTDFKTEADKAMHAHVWGKGAKYVGKSVSAYASSYTCFRCLKSLYDLTKEDILRCSVSEWKGNIVTFQTPHGSMNTFIKEKDIKQIGATYSSTEDGLKKFIKVAKDFARPPVNDHSEVLSVFFPDLFQNKEWLNRIKRQRGSSCVFICPFCGFVADADIQAAFFMAVRGFLRFAGIVSSDPNTGSSFLLNTRELLQKNDLEALLNYFVIR